MKGDLNYLIVPMHASGNVENQDGSDQEGPLIGYQIQAFDRRGRFSHGSGIFENQRQAQKAFRAFCKRRARSRKVKPAVSRLDAAIARALGIGIGELALLETKLASIKQRMRECRQKVASLKRATGKRRVAATRG